MTNIEDVHIPARKLSIRKKPRGTGMAFHPRGIVTLTDCVVSLWIGIMRASIAHIVCGWFLATCTRYAVMPRGASGFSGSVNSSPTYSRRFDDPLFDLTREAILRAFLVDGHLAAFCARRVYEQECVRRLSLVSETIR